MTPKMGVIAQNTGKSWGPCPKKGVMGPFSNGHGHVRRLQAALSSLGTPATSFSLGSPRSCQNWLRMKNRYRKWNQNLEQRETWTAPGKNLRKLFTYRNKWNPGKWKHVPERAVQFLVVHFLPIPYLRSPSLFDVAEGEQGKPHQNSFFWSWFPFLVVTNVLPFFWRWCPVSLVVLKGKPKGEPKPFEGT